MLKSLFHWKVLVNLVLAAVIFIGLVWLTFRWLELHTNHGKEIPVPNVMNRSVHEAIKILDDQGLEYKVDSGTYDPKYKPFQVLNMFPKPGSRVKNGRIIEVRVNPRTWGKVTIPDILDRYKGLAFRRLAQVGLKVGDTIFEPSIQRDAVIRMLHNGVVIKPGSQLPRFSTIDLVIGAGPKRNIAIPNLVGLTVAQAKAIVANNLFEIGLVEYEDGKGDDTDIVYYQDPAGGDLRDQGMQVDLWASKKSPAEMSGRISQLNSMYRVKIDTTLPPVRYEEIPVYQEPTFEAPRRQPAEPKPATPTSPTNTPAENTSKKPSNNSGTAVPKSEPASGKQPAATPANKTAEKPKVKKVVE
ncbi:PASTA domain-containing protein [Chryseobacterium sp.]|uniref:PASTA domain-containing protein n=1 Tax=Chryseobacterium sp. TaxID=1871047 RepID=UPI0012A9BD59|nr:PASTA domain-containing protein [Chryseobacterium sp.]QFG52469.1 PASTA domain-containing protein [Chryseobacterium sp.]